MFEIQQTRGSGRAGREDLGRHEIPYIERERMIVKTFSGIFLVSAIALAMTPALALSETETYSCRYESYSNEKGLHKVQDEFKLVFIVDTSSGTAQQVTDRGKFNVEMLPALNGGMTLVEMIDGGKILTTSIDNSGRSVHSRNIILEGHIAPSQYYGRCSKR